MEIRQLISFEKIVELGSFTKAADYLGYTQSTITAHIQDLENSLGVKLFDKIGRKNVLTYAGKELIIYTRELLQIVNKINHLSEKVSNNEDLKGEIKIGAPESITVYLLQPLLKKYRQKFPKVTITLVNGNCIYLKDLLLRGELDITFLMMEEFENPNLVINKINEENIVIVGNKDFDFNKLDLINKNHNIEQCIILNEKDCSYRRSFENYLNSKKITANNTMELWSIEAIKQCVKSDLGISILPEITVKDDIQNGELKSINCDFLDNKICSLFVYHKNKWISQALGKFITMCKDLSK